MSPTGVVELLAVVEAQTWKVWFTVSCRLLLGWVEQHLGIRWAAGTLDLLQQSGTLRVIGGKDLRRSGNQYYSNNILEFSQYYMALCWQRFLGQWLRQILFKNGSIEADKQLTCNQLNLKLHIRCWPNAMIKKKLQSEMEEKKTRSKRSFKSANKCKQIDWGREN